MKKQEFEETVFGLVWVWINNRDLQGENAQISVNPVSLFVDLLTQREFQQAIEDSDEAVENAAYAHDAAQYEAMDFQASQNPDFYPAKSLTRVSDEGKTEPDSQKIEAMASNYFKA